jgi:DNA-directed RNA polymerase beta subunit
MTDHKKSDVSVTKDVFETLCRSFKTMSPPELIMPPQSNLLMSYVKKYGYGHGAIQIFDNWLDETLPKQLASRDLITEGVGALKVSNIRIDKPRRSKTMAVGENRMTPKYAQDHDNTYSGIVTATITFEHVKIENAYGEHGYSQKPTEIVKENHIIGSVPIMVGSKYCWLHGISDAEKIKLGECPNDPLGYFIIKGTPRVINIEDGLRALLFHTSHDKKKDIIETKTTCPTAKGSTVTNILVCGGWKTLNVRFQYLFQKKYPIFLVYVILRTDRATLQTVIESETPLVEYVKSLCGAFLEEIRMYCQSDNDWKQVYLALQSSYTEAINACTHQFVFYLAEKTRIPHEDVTSDVYGSYDIIRNMTLQDLYSHVPVDFKSRHLALGALNTVKYLLGLRELDNRDSWINKRLDASGKSMEKLLNTVLSNIYKDAYEKKSTGKTRDYGLSNIDFPMITDTFKKSFQPNNWGYKDDGSKENKTDVLKRDNSITIHSQIRRINTPSSRQTRSPAIRMVQFSQTGYVCVSETPEGETLGLLKYMAISCIISVDRSVDDVIGILTGKDFKTIVSVQYSEGWIPMMVNGILYFWIHPPFEDAEIDILGRKKTVVETYLIKCKRSGFLPYDSCIVFNPINKMLEYFCDSSRPMRPLLIVDENEDLVIDVLAKDDPDIWKRDPEELIKLGAVEMLDTREQEYIMLAMDVDSVRQRKDRKKYLTSLIGKFSDYEGEIKTQIKHFLGLVDKVSVINNHGKAMYEYFWGVAKLMRKDLDTDRLANNYLFMFNDYITAIIFTIVKMVYNQEELTEEIVFNSGDVIAAKYVMDIKDEDKRQNEIDISKIQKPPRDDFTQHVIDMIAPKYDMENIIENTKSLYINELKELNKRIPFTHSEIDVSAIFGVSASLQPRPNCSQGPRSTYQASMSKQSLGFYHFNHHLKFDKTYKIMQNPTRPTFETLSSEATGLNTAPTGTSIIVAFIALTDNNEDAIVFNRDFMLTNGFDIVKYSTRKVEISHKSINGMTELLVKPDIKPGEPAIKYHAIDDFGIPVLDKYISPGDCVIGRVKIDTTTGIKINTSLFAGIGEEGYVDRITIRTDSNRNMVVNVKLRRFSKHITGDKIASRYAQKGTASTIYESTELPEIIGGPNDGVVPDAFINPHSIPSRMSTNKLQEMMLAKSALWTNERGNATCFHDYDIDKWATILEQNDQHKYGNETMMWPTGKEITNIFVGPCYYQCLRHHAKDKYQARARGKIMPITHQPVGGRANEGGLRIGEMERDGLISHGASGIVLERLMYVSDAYDIAFCKTCGNIAIPDVVKDEFICKVCDSQKARIISNYPNGVPIDVKVPEPEFISRTIPYVLKVIFQMLNGMGINTTLKFKKPFGEHPSKYINALY